MVLNNSKYGDIWNSVLLKLEQEINDANAFESFFFDTKIVSIDGNTITISAPNAFSAEILNRRYLELIQSLLNETTQSNYKCTIIDASTITEKTVTLSPQKPVFMSNLNPKFAFENFVIGPSNRESYVASLAIAMDPGNFYNPLFIFGRSGLGKTHLLHAIGNYIRIKNPSANILYTSTDDFIDQVIRAFKDSSGIEGLKDLYRQVDVLLLDDIQFLSSKEKTKEVLFNIFNTLINNGKQIVLTSDRPPYELKSIEDRLVGRFSSGLTIEIKALEFETAYQILKRKVEALDPKHNGIDEEVLKYIVSNYSTDVRDLEGALNKLLFYSITFNPGEVINMEIATRALESLSKKSERNAITIEKIKMVVANYYNISPTRLESKTRTADITVARHIAMYLCRTILDASLNKIGSAFGGKDHSTVINACEKVDKLLKENEDYQVAITELTSKIKG